MLDLTRQYETIKDDVHAAIERVLTSQHFIGGPELEGFERESASYLGVRASVGCALGHGRFVACSGSRRSWAGGVRDHHAVQFFRHR